LLRLARPAKRNALSDSLVQQLHQSMLLLPEATRALVISGSGDHFRQSQQGREA
jgi:(methylthio)acryloyl-CoA hydratase